MENSIKEDIKKRYSQIAVSGNSDCCCMPGECKSGDSPIDATKLIGYDQKELGSIPQESILGVGCGAPLNHANLKEGVDDLPWMPEFFARFSDMVNSIQDVGSLDIRSPYLSVPKAEVFEHADEMGVGLSETWSCLRPGKIHCGECRSCRRRKQAFKNAGMKDDTQYEK